MLREAFPCVYLFLRDLYHFPSSLVWKVRLYLKTYGCDLAPPSSSPYAVASSYQTMKRDVAFGGRRNLAAQSDLLLSFMLCSQTRQISRFQVTCQKSELDCNQMFSTPRQLTDSLKSRLSLSDPDALHSSSEGKIQETIHILFVRKDSILPIHLPFCVPCFLCGSCACCPCCCCCQQG